MSVENVTVCLLNVYRNDKTARSFSPTKLVFLGEKHWFPHRGTTLFSPGKRFMGENGPMPLSGVIFFG
jgi:hypothetical protein